MVIIGSWTTVFYPGITNGYGVNIRVPANTLNGQIVARASGSVSWRP